jgi:predicted alpha/beta hydrolase
MHRFVEAADGQRISARFFHPEGEVKGAVLIVPAMGVSQDYYEPFARWLAQQGFTAATFDYRGTGRSRPSKLRGFKADIFDWARLDCAAMIDALPQQPLYWIGHSLGGQILGLVPNKEFVTKAITVATGSGYWRENTPRIRPMAWWLWFVVTPPALALWGYFPGKALRKVGDLPKGVMAQWRRWCLDPDYAVGAEGVAIRAQYAAVRTPIVSLSFADDEMMSLRNTESIHGFYAAAPRIGHFGFFRSVFEASLWRAHLLPELT